MWVGTFSGVTSPGMVISSALVGTTMGNSSPTSDRMIDVFPHWAVCAHVRIYQNMCYITRTVGTCVELVYRLDKRCMHLW